MASHFDYTVTEDESPFIYMGDCYLTGDVVSMRAYDYARKAKKGVIESSGKKVWPTQCYEQGAFVLQQNRNMHVIPPGTPLAIEIPTIDGIAPNRVSLNWCGSCFLVDLDKEVVVGDITDLQAPVINPRYLWIGPDPETGADAPTVIHVFNKGDSDLCLTLSYEC